MIQGFPNGLKTVLKKEKLLVLENSSMCNIVFREIILSTHSIIGLFGKVLTTVMNLMVNWERPD